MIAFCENDLEQMTGEQQEDGSWRFTCPACGAEVEVRNAWRAAA